MYFLANSVSSCTLYISKREPLRNRKVMRLSYLKIFIVVVWKWQLKANNFHMYFQFTHACTLLEIEEGVRTSANRKVPNLSVNVLKDGYWAKTTRNVKKVPLKLINLFHCQKSFYRTCKKTQNEHQRNKAALSRNVSCQI